MEQMIISLAGLNSIKLEMAQTVYAHMNKWIKKD
jgi:hypothetical protein